MLRYLLIATVLALRAEFENCKEFTDVAPPGGRPPPFAGQWFITVWSAAESNQDDRSEGLDETYTVKVTITFRMAWAPRDRRGTIATANAELYDYADRAKLRIHNSYDLMNEANNQASGAANAFINGCVEPLSYQSTSYQDRDPSWVWSDKEAPESAGENNIYTAELTFGRGRSVRYPRENG